MRRRYILLILASAVASMGAVQRTPNFIVNAPTPQICAQVAQYAEQYRREKAQLWLGEEMPQWPQPCPLYVTVSMEPPSGATTFSFGHNQVMGMRMEIKGPLDRLLASVLPHEITHTVFAHHFRCPLPRWADEGGSVLSEDQVERDRHDKLVRNLINQGRAIRMRTLFSLKEYPRDVLCLYAEGFSMTDFLVQRSDRRTFLKFIAHGMSQGWDGAVQTYYRHRTVEELETAWLGYLRDGRRLPDAQIAANQGNQRPAQIVPTSGTVVRLTAPPIPPLDPAPIARGAMPAPEQTGQRFGNPPGAPTWPGEQRPMNPPPAFPSAPPPNPGGWQPSRFPGQSVGQPSVQPVQPMTPSRSFTPPPGFPSAPPPPQVILGAPIYDQR